MSKKIVLITGSRKGIGRFLAERYSSAGYDVVGCSRKEAAPLENYTHFCVDVSDEASVVNMFHEIKKKYGRLDVLINNAGIASMNHSLLTPLETASRIINVNFCGTFLCCREAARLMLPQKKGRIVNFSTVAVPLKLAGEAVYAASKAAVATLTQILSYEYGSQGITVNAIGPTPIDTDLIRAVPKNKLDELTNRMAIKRFGTFQDVGNVIDFFLKDESDFVTGQIIYLGGV
ncbi:MAG: SDR family oxidoreductase [Planctomycetaceae bacterium]|nr:SDR family oxidoreductase [Planctomycetaceae bacterium]